MRSRVRTRTRVSTRPRSISSSATAPPPWWATRWKWRPSPSWSGAAAAGPAGLAWHNGEVEELVELVTRIDVGRGRDNNLQLAHDGQLSRHHATLERREAGVYILDRESLNGVWVNGERVAERRLFGGEAIVLGETAFRWRG